MSEHTAVVDALREAEKKIARVRALHVAALDSSTYWCDEDGHTYPCATIRALDGEVPTVNPGAAS